MRFAIIVDDTTKVGRGFLDVARSLERFYKSVVIEKWTGKSSSGDYRPSKQTVLAVNDAVHGRIERVDDVDDFFNNIR